MSVNPSPEAVFTELRQLAPDIAYSVYLDVKDDPVPVLKTRKHLERMLSEGYREHVVEASAVMVMGDEAYEGKAYMTGFFYGPGEVDPDLDGWLPHILWNATISLANEFGDDLPQAASAIKYLDGVRRAREKVRNDRRYPRA